MLKKFINPILCVLGLLLWASVHAAGLPDFMSKVTDLDGLFSVGDQIA